MTVLVPNTYLRRYSVRELQAMRDRALKAAQDEYEATRRQILREYKAALENNGHAPAKGKQKA